MFLQLLEESSTISKCFAVANKYWFQIKLSKSNVYISLCLLADSAHIMYDLNTSQIMCNIPCSMSVSGHFS